MTLRRKIVSATLVLVASLGCGVAWLAADLVQQGRMVESSAVTVRAATALAIRLQDAANGEARLVLAVRAPAGDSAATRISAASAEVERIADAIGALGIPRAVEPSWSEYRETRRTLTAIRGEVVSAASRGDATALGIALDRWRVVATRADALLRNFVGYHLRSIERTVADLQTRRERALALAGAMLLAGAALALGFSLALTRTVVQPIVAIASAADHVTASDQPTPVGGAQRDDEVGTLARAFNEMTSRLVAANRSLSDADRRKDEFLAVLSHELRNPLAPIRNSVAVLEKAEPDGDQARSARAVLRRQVDQLAHLVDELLDTTRISRGRIALQRDVVDLSSIVARAAEDHRTLFSERGIRLECHVPDDAVHVDGDRARLAQAIGNLLHNAAKFSERGGAVVVRLARADGQARISVRDDGVGIDADLLAHVFEPFVQAERTLARSSGGLGLGLPIVKGLVELHGGTVSAASGGQGRGAEFVVTLPTVQPPPAAAAAPAPAPATTRATAPPPASRRDVLVIDDNVDAATSLAELIEIFGHRATVAFDANAGLEHARRSPPNVILCDLGLPGMDGYEFARAARADPRLRDVCLVAISGYARAEDRRRSADAGFDEHVAKPADPRDLERLLAR